MIKSPEIGRTLSFSGDFMQPKQRVSDQGDLFRSRLDQILNRQHSLFKLADFIDWSVFEKEFGSLYVENVGRPGLPIRLMVALHYLKHAFNVSDEAVVDQLIENGYWQYFCGFEYFQHEFPLDPTSLVKWRKRIGHIRRNWIMA
jgi:IS5 family transposase